LYWSTLVDVELQLGDYEAVLRDIDRARGFHRELTGLLVPEVEALARLGRVEEATDRAIEILESSDQSRTNMQLQCCRLPKVLRVVGLDEQALRVAEVGAALLRRMEVAYPDFIACALMNAGRFDEARQVLARGWDSVSAKSRAYGLLAYMAATDGNVEEATRLSEMAVTADDPAGIRRSPTGVMSQVACFVATSCKDPIR